MPATIKRSDKNRSLGIGTPLGEDKLLLLEMHGTESLGRLFEYELDLIAEDNAVDYTKILGQNVTIRLAMRDSKVRYFNGFISRFTFLGVDDTRKNAKRIFQYRATLVPWPWFLTRAANCRIFQEMKVPDIIKKVCKDKGFTDIDNQLTGKYRQWDYCVQYRETDFNFISRLMEEEGIYYYFKHEDGKHQMVLCDAPSAHSAAPDYDSLHFHDPNLSAQHDAYVWDWVIGHEVTPTEYVLDDYNMVTPKTELLRSKKVKHPHIQPQFEIFDYPGGYPTGDDGVKYANVRLEEVESQYVSVHTSTSARGVHAGAIFKLEDHPTLDAEEYLVTAATYHLRNDDMALPQSRGSGPTYSAQLTCIPKLFEFRTPRLTPKPVVQGPQTAVIVGPAGEEIYTDKYSRVKVQFHWDREGKKDEHSSLWIRVSQPVAGKGYGDVNIPRIGHEVIVDFLEGDPDQPIITGRVYNADNMPPYALPGSKMVRGSKTNSTPGGGGSNEMSMDDTKGKEKITIHAQFDMSTTVENDQTDVIHNNRTTTIDVDDTETVTGNQKIDITGNQDVAIKGNQTQAITGNQDESIKGNQTLKVTGNQSFDITGNQSHTVNGTHTTSAKGKLSLSSNAAIEESAPDIKLDATASIKLSAGGSSIEISASGIKITSPAIVDIKGAMIKNNG